MGSGSLSATLAFVLSFRLFGHLTEPRLAGREIHRVAGEGARVEAPARGSELKVVTWNIQHGKHFDRIVDELRRLDADLYLLQEVDVFCRRSGNRHVARDLADALGMNWVFVGEFQEIGQSAGAGAALTGQAILSKFPITHATAVRLRAQAWARWHLNPVQPRRGGRLALQADVAGVRLYNLHLESGGDEKLRRRQLGEVLERDARDRRPSAILAGDLNTGPAFIMPSPALAAAGFGNALDAPAANKSTRPPRSYPIDRILVRRLQSDGGRTIHIEGASDHDPVMVTVRTDAQR